MHVLIQCTLIHVSAASYPELVLESAPITTPPSYSTAIMEVCKRQKTGGGGGGGGRGVEGGWTKEGQNGV